MARALVVGAGIGGLAAGAALQHRGWEVTVVERAAALVAVGAGLALAPTALKALAVIGGGDRVRTRSALQGEAGIRRPDGRWISQTSAEAAEARYGDPTFVLHRAALVELLASALTPGTLRLGVEVTAVDAAAGRITAGGEDLTADLVVAADGINSQIRRALVPSHPGPVYAGATSWRMVVPPPPPDGVLAGEIWGRGQVFGIAPLGDGRVYCYAAAVTPAGGRAPDERAEVLRLFGSWNPPVPQLVAGAETVLRTDLRCLDTPLRRFHYGRVALLGDAAHAMTPHLGQGACQAIEDAVVLASVADRPDGLARYTALRLPRTTAVAAASRRIGRLTTLSGAAAVWARDNAMRLAGRIGPNLVLRQMDPVLGWRPPTG